MDPSFRLMVDSSEFLGPENAWLVAHSENLTRQGRTVVGLKEQDIEKLARYLRKSTFRRGIAYICDGGSPQVVGNPAIVDIASRAGKPVFGFAAAPLVSFDSQKVKIALFRQRASKDPIVCARPDKTITRGINPRRLFPLAPSVFLFSADGVHEYRAGKPRRKLR
jgi:hypothetical protein